MTSKIELIHQWQAIGRAHPELLRHEAFKNCKKLGITSLQSYVYWAEVEKRPSEVDFSAYDDLVGRLKKHRLKWVPFVILGPHYATPVWFQKTDESVYARCLEHGHETKIQSIWNPNLPRHVDRFLRLLGERYDKSGVLESVELGISGNWGEALYPATGGFSMPKDLHAHPGWWCGDEYAVSSFRSSMREKHGSIKKVNSAWGERFRDSDEIHYPEVTPNFLRWYAESMRNLAKFGVRMVSRRSTVWDRGSIGSMRLKYPSLQEIKRHPGKLARWLDFVQWYLDSMTGWAERWVKIARKYFPRQRIYLATGGDNNPILGADFSAQAKVTAKHMAGLRITNQENEYSRTFVLTRLAACSSKFYGSYFTVEEAWHDSPEGTASRIFDAATSGARGIYFKDILGNDIDSRWTRSRGLVLGRPTPNALTFSKNIPYSTGDAPIVEVAVVFPSTSIALNPVTLGSVYGDASRLRDLLDFDIVDENMVADGALRVYRFLILLGGQYLRKRTLVKIGDWVKRGGVLIDANVGPRAVEDGARLYGNSHVSGVTKVGRGFILVSRDREKFRLIKNAVYNVGLRYPWKGTPEIDGVRDGIYATRFSDRILYFNSTGEPKTKRVEITNSPKRIEFELKLKPHSICSVDLDQG